MSLRMRPAIPMLPARQSALRARRDRIIRGFATFVAALTAAIAVVIVAAAAVAFAIG